MTSHSVPHRLKAAGHWQLTAAFVSALPPAPVHFAGEAQFISNETINCCGGLGGLRMDMQAEMAESLMLNIDSWDLSFFHR